MMLIIAIKKILSYETEESIFNLPFGFLAIGS